MLFWVYAIGWTLGLLLVPWLARRYEPAKAWAWIFIFFMLPFVGILLFTMLADNPLGRLRRRRHTLEELDGARRLSPLKPFVVEKPTGERLWGIDRLTWESAGLRPVGGNDGRVICEDKPQIDQIVADIEAARHHVHVTMYIFEDDATGRRVGEALAAAAQRGVKVRVLADDLGSRKLFRKLGPWMVERGVDLRATMPTGMFRRRIFRFDIRNHRKLVIADGRVGHIGSRNIINANYGNEELGACRELMVRTRGPIVAQLQLAFLEDWHFQSGDKLDDPALFPTPESCGEHVMQALPSGPLYLSAPVRDVAVAAIHAAHERVILTTPYMVPDDASLLALRLAAARGVRVDLIVSRKSDSSLAAAAGRAHYASLLEGKVNVYVHRHRFVHTKALTVDRELAMIGSANFDHRSFRLNMESNLLLYSEPLIAEIVALQERYIQGSEKLDAKKWDARPWPMHVRDDLAKLLGPLI